MKKSRMAGRNAVTRLLEIILKADLNSKSDFSQSTGHGCSRTLFQNLVKTKLCEMVCKNVDNALKFGTCLGSNAGEKADKFQ